MTVCRLTACIRSHCFAMSASLVWLAMGTLSFVDAAPPWTGMPYTMFRDMQAVHPDGTGAWNMPMWPPSSEQGYRLRGVVLNAPADMLDGTARFVPSGPDTRGKTGGQWQVFIQFQDDPTVSDDDQDFGGAAIWMGQNYGNLWFHYGCDEFSYRNDEWIAEVARVSLNGTLKPGDLIEVRARGGWFHNGKQNVTEQHSNAEETDFDVTRLGHVGLPSPTLIGFSDIKNDDNSFKFVPDRSQGAEHYQGTLVRMNGVRLLPGGTWGPDGLVTITDNPREPAYTLAMKLGRNPGFRSVGRPVGPFDVIGIFDQDGPDPRAGYRLWVVDPRRIHSTQLPSL